MSTRRSAIRRQRLTWPFGTILTRGASPLQYLTLTLMGVLSGGIAAWSLSPVPATLVGYRASTLAFPAVAVGGIAYLSFKRLPSSTIGGGLYLIAAFVVLRPFASSLVWFERAATSTGSAASANLVRAATTLYGEGLVAGVFAVALGVIAWRLHRRAERKIRIRRRDARRRPLYP